MEETEMLLVGIATSKWNDVKQQVYRSRSLVQDVLKAVRVFSMPFGYQARLLNDCFFLMDMGVCVNSEAQQRSTRLQSFTAGVRKRQRASTSD
jgi:hypothetical protein